MKWIKFTLDTTTEAVDLVSSMLNDMGIEGIEVRDNVALSDEEKRHMFVDILPDLPEDDGTAQIDFYVDSSQDPSVILNNVRKGLNEISQWVSIGSGNIAVTDTKDEDWVNNWKKYFIPFRLDDTIVIKPTWVELTDLRENDVVIEIDPGISFGTGSHETTKLCIHGLKKNIKPGDTVLDAGSGSGILSIIAKKLGAGEVLGIDIDPDATKTAIENAGVNKLPVEEHSLSFVTGNIIKDGGIRDGIGKGRFDIVVANILADVIIPLSSVVGENLKDGGIFISSGIINTKEDEVRESLIRNRFEILEVNKMNDWVSFIARK